MNRFTLITIAFVAYITLSFFHSSSFILDKEILRLTLMIFALLALAVILFPRFVIDRNFSFRKDEIIVGSICIIGLISGTVINPPSFSNTTISNKYLFNITKPIEFIVIYLAISTVSNSFRCKEDLKRLFRFFVYSGILHVFASIVIYCFSNSNPYQGKIVFTGIYNNYNFFGWAVMIACMSSLSLFFIFLEDDEKSSAYKYFIFTIIFVIFIIFSYSRSAFLGTAIFIGISSILFLKSGKGINFILSKKHHLLLFLVFSAVVAVGAVVILILKTKLHGSSKRFDLWYGFFQEQLRVVPNAQFFLGHGYEWGADYYKKFAVGQSHVHNNYLFLWDIYGVTAIGLFFVWIANILKILFRNINEYFYLHSIFISYLFIFLFDDLFSRRNINHETMFFIIISTLIIKLNKQRNNTIASE